MSRHRFSVEATDNGFTIRHQGRLWVFEASPAGNLRELESTAPEGLEQLMAQALLRGLEVVAPRVTARGSRWGVGLGLVAIDQESGAQSAVEEVPAPAELAVKGEG